MRLELPQTAKNHRIHEVLSATPKERQIAEHIATIRAAPNDALRAMAAANVARWILQ